MADESSPSPRPTEEGVPPVCRRLFGDQANRYAAYVHAASDYRDNLTPDERLNLYRKPFDDPRIGNAAYYERMYEILNLVQAMDLPPRAHILEVGSGAGWVTELLIGLGFEVAALEPSKAMIEVAHERLATFAQHYRLSKPPTVTFYATTLEECTLPEGVFDAILYFASLHHIIDEDTGLDRTFRLLKPGGILGIGCEPNWQPGHLEQESLYREEAARFGILENPFTFEYLAYLLHKHGFTRVVRYHGINGLFPIEFEGIPIGQAAQAPAAFMNTVTACKPALGGPTTADGMGTTLGEIDVLSSAVDRGARTARLRVKLTNRGETIWLHRSRGPGWVTLALRQGEIGAAAMREAQPRQQLPRSLHPGDTLELDAVFQRPADEQPGSWSLDLVSEGMFWFSTRGTTPAPVNLG